MRSTNSLTLLPGPLWPRVIAHDRVLYMGRVELKSNFFRGKTLGKRIPLPMIPKIPFRFLHGFRSIIIWGCIFFSAMEILHIIKGTRDSVMYPEIFVIMFPTVKFLKLLGAQSTGAVEYTDCIYAEG